MQILLDTVPVPPFISEAILQHTGPIDEATPVGGGCIANATRISGSKGTFFLKWGTQAVSRTFSAEASGLNALRLAGSSLTIPEVVACSSGEQGYILLEWLHQGHASPQSWEVFGRGLATLHRSSVREYGFEEDNFIGRSSQTNTPKETWPAFFRTCRLAPQVQLARQQGRWRPGWDELVEGLYNRLDTLLPIQPEASLLHGDLWGGNFMTLTNGQVALIDPAVYYGHREADLAMTELFGGFRQQFYEAYWEAWPVEEGYGERKEIYNLYHLLNHLNLFGGSYERGVDAVLKRFGG